jgi:hypothetical protein
MANHYEFKIICKYPLRQEEQALFNFEFVHKKTPQIAFLFRTY